MILADKVLQFSFMFQFLLFVGQKSVKNLFMKTILCFLLSVALGYQLFIFPPNQRGNKTDTGRY